MKEKITLLTTIIKYCNQNNIKLIITVHNKKGKRIYFQRDGLWWKKEYDTRGNLIRTEDCDGHWSEIFYD